LVDRSLKNGFIQPCRMCADVCAACSRATSTRNWRTSAIRDSVSVIPPVSAVSRQWGRRPAAAPTTRHRKAITASTRQAMIREDPRSDLVMPMSACLLRPVVGDEAYGRSSGLRAARNAASRATGRPAPPAADTTQPAAWRDAGKPPATAHDPPPGADPGMVKVSVPEARLLRLATTQRPPHVNSATSGHDGGDDIKPATDSTTTRHNSSRPNLRHSASRWTCPLGDPSTSQHRELTVDSEQLRRDAGNTAWLLL
jgi:hypothetical protein